MSIAFRRPGSERANAPGTRWSLRRSGWSPGSSRGASRSAGRPRATRNRSLHQGVMGAPTTTGRSRSSRGIRRRRACARKSCGGGGIGADHAHRHLRRQGAQQRIIAGEHIGGGIARVLDSDGAQRARVLRQQAQGSLPEAAGLPRDQGSDRQPDARPPGRDCARRCTGRLSAVAGRATGVKLAMRLVARGRGVPARCR